MIFDNPKAQQKYKAILNFLDLDVSIDGYKLDQFGKKISFNGIKNLPGPGTIIPSTQDRETELLRCRSDILYFKSWYCRILTSKGVALPEQRDYQDKLLTDFVTGADTVINYPRQSSKTVSTAIYLLHSFLFETDLTIGIAANVSSLAREVLNKIKEILLLLPVWMIPNITVFNKSSIASERGNKILTSATNGNSFRGFSIKLLYLDEVGFISANDWDDFSDSVFPAMASFSDSQLIMSSTPNGKNFWYDIVQGAKQEDSEYTYQTIDWRIVPRYNKDRSEKPPEEFKREQVSKFGKLAFAQNFELNFLGSSDTLIDTVMLGFETKEYRTDFHLADGFLRIFEEPQGHRNYVLGADPCKGVGGDPAGIQVIDVTELPFKQVASGQFPSGDFIEFPEVIYQVGTFYNNAFVVNEINIAESVPEDLIQELEYEGDVYYGLNKNNKMNIKAGFLTTTRSKLDILTQLKKLIETNMLVLVCEATRSELETFIKVKNSYAASQGKHDDLVMSLAIALAPMLGKLGKFTTFSKLAEDLKLKDEQEQDDFMAAYDFDWS